MFNGGEVGKWVDSVGGANGGRLGKWVRWGKQGVGIFFGVVHWS